MEQAFEDRVKLGLRLLILNLFAYDSPKPSMFRQELDNFDVKLVLETEGQD